MTTLLPGQILQSRYKILREIGHAARTLDYLAEDIRLGNRQVVVRGFDVSAVSLADLQTSLAQFSSMASMIAGFSHRGIRQLLDFFVDGSAPYIVTERIEGETLEDYARLHPAGVSVTLVREWGAQLCDVLTHLHSTAPPIIHRDIRPATVAVTNTGALKIIDFGLARSFKVGKGLDTILLFTPGYSPPEQYGQGQTAPHSDIYSLGVTLHSLVTGFDPTHATFNLPAAIQLRPEVGQALSEALRKATDPVSANRFQTASDFRAALLSIDPVGVAQSAQAAPNSPIVATKRIPETQQVNTTRRGKGWLVAALAAGALAVSAAVWVILGSGAPPAALEATATPVASDFAKPLDNRTSIAFTATAMPVASPTVLRLAATSTLAPTATLADGGATRTRIPLDATAVPALTTADQASKRTRIPLVATSAPIQQYQGVVVATPTPRSAPRPAVGGAMQLLGNAMFRISPRLDWQSAGITVQVNQFVLIKYVRGQWRIAPTDTYTNHEGHANAGNPRAPRPDLRSGVLICRIGSAVFEPRNVPGGFRSGANGLLTCRINDDKLSDNDGALDMEITVQ